MAEKAFGEFALVINFDRGTRNPARVFSAAQKFIEAFELLDQSLLRSIDPSLKTELLLDDIEQGSIRIWLSNVLKAVDDQALKDLDWKPAIGKYLVRSKYVALHWLSSESTGSLQDLKRDLMRIASDTDARHLPDYSAPENDSLLGSLEGLKEAGDILHSTDKISFVSDGKEYEIDVSRDIKVSEIRDLAIKQSTIVPAAEMILTVKKPDYLGTSKWSFKYGKKTLSASISDQDWLLRFQRRKVDVRPGDALRCSVEITMNYGFENELVSEEYEIKSVIEVIFAESPPDDLFNS